jgi:uncharacterized protein
VNAGHNQGEPPTGLPAEVPGVPAMRGREPPPVHLWDPPHCGDSLMRIAADGTWLHQDTPIARPALVRLFASILRRDGEDYVLVTPVEKLSIAVEDAPFVAVALRVEGRGAAQRLHFSTNLGEEVTAGPAHPLRFARDAAGGLKPYVRVRGELWARLARALLYELAELAEEREDGTVGVVSDGVFFPMALADETAVTA